MKLFECSDPPIIFLFEQIVSYSKDFIKATFEDNLLNFFSANRFFVQKNNQIVFSFSGVVSHRRKIIFILPKHFKLKIPDSSSDQEGFFLAKGRELIEILAAYESQIEVNLAALEFYNISSAGEVNEIRLAQFILEDYVSYGLWYYNTEYTSFNGPGEILWEKTVEDAEPVHHRQVPVYFDSYNLSQQVNYSSLITQIHRWAVCYCSHRYGKLLNIETDADRHQTSELEDFGEREYLIAALEKELRVCFRVREIKLLKYLIELLNLTDNSQDSNFSLFGKNKFQNIWESALAFIFCNEYSKYKGLVPQPKWTLDEIEFPGDSLKPDILKVYNENLLLVLDAKYYLIEMRSLPGVNDIVKQYFYQMVLTRSNIASEVSWRRVLNIFIFPGYGCSLFTVKGHVKIENDGVTQPIINLSFNPDEVFERFIKQSVLTPAELNDVVEASTSHIRSLIIPDGNPRLP